MYTTGSREIPSKFNPFTQNILSSSYNQLLHSITFQDKTLSYNNKPIPSKNHLNKLQINTKQYQTAITPSRILDAPKVTTNTKHSPIDWSHNNVIALALSSKLYLRYLHTETTQLIAEIHDQYQFTCVRWSQQSPDILCAANSFGELQIIDAGQKRVLQTLQVNDTVTQASFNDGLVGCLSEKKGILLYDLRGKECFNLLSETQHFSSLELSEEVYLAGGSAKGEVIIWDIRNLRVRVQTFKEHKGEIRSLEWRRSKLGQVMCCGGDGKVTICSVLSGCVLNEYWMDSGINGGTWYGDELYCGLVNGWIGMVNGIRLEKHCDSVIDVCMSPCGYELCSLGVDELLIFWDLDKQLNTNKQLNNNSIQLR